MAPPAQHRNPPADDDDDADDPDDAIQPDEEQDDAAAAFGLHIVEPPPPPASGPVCWLWPENVPLWNAWQQLQGQWRITAMGQHTGLDYAGVTQWLRAHGYGPSRRRNLHRALDAFAGMERAFLNAMAQRQTTHPRRP